MNRYCLPSIGVNHTPTLGHQLSKQLTCSAKEDGPDYLHKTSFAPCKQNVGVKQTACIPGCMANSRYSTCDWEAALENNFNMAEQERMLAERLRSNTWCLVQSSEKRLHDRQCNNTRKLGERVCDIGFWKEQLLAELQLMETECDNLQECIRVLQRTLCETKLPLSIVEECLMQREKRLGMECCHDDVERTLCKEAEVIRNIQEKLKEYIQKAQCQFRKDRSCQHDCDIDVRDKHHAQTIDDLSHQLRNRSCKIGFFPNVERIDNTVTTKDTWMQFTQNNIAKSHFERDVTEALRSEIQCLLQTSAKEMWNRFNVVNTAIFARIQEVTNARNRLQDQLVKANNEIRDLDRTIQLLRRSIKEREEQLKVAQTRLDERSRRRCVELCHDDPMVLIKKEVQDIYDVICQLKEKLRQVENALCKMLKKRTSLEQDIAIKEKTIQIDSAFCLGLRKKMPMDPKVGPVFTKPHVQC